MSNSNPKMASSKLVVREDKAWEQVVYAEVLVPNVLNSYGDVYTPEAIKKFCQEFARQGYGIDIDHNQIDVTGQAYVIESFIAREGDPDFIPGSWVVGMKIEDAAIWQAILDGDLNGYSFEAIVNMTEFTATVSGSCTVTGVTDPHPIDGHTHTYVLTLDELNQPSAGATSVDNGHSHRIVSHTVTEVSDGHNHRFQIIGVENCHTLPVEVTEE